MSATLPHGLMDSLPVGLLDGARRIDATLNPKSTLQPMVVLSVMAA
ncbi:MAG: hypothetical protein P8M73_10995 [Luminiphilus sp.]|nr:hypothetical protein [Luminiphilus sp.]